MLKFLKYFFVLSVLFFWSCQKKQIVKENLILDSKIQEIKEQYEKTAEAQNLGLSLIWEKTNFQVNDAGVVTIPLKDQKNTYLFFLKGTFWYQRILEKPNLKEKLNLIYNSEGILQFARHHNNGRVDAYALKNDAYNFYEHHINSKSQKYRTWEAFDFLDFEYIENVQEWMSNFLVYQTNFRLPMYMICSNAVSASLDYFDIMSDQIIDSYYQGSINMNEYYLQMCTLSMSMPAYIISLGCTDPAYSHIYDNMIKLYCGYLPEPITPVDPNKPCPRDPIKDPSIAPSKPGNYEGGRFREDARKQEKPKGSGILVNRRHNGLDIASPLNSPVYSMYDGKVVAAATLNDFGNFVMIESTINGVRVQIFYAHLNQMDVSKGQNVTQGQNLGLTGNTGNANNDKIIPHVHIETKEYNNIDKTWNRVDPEKYVGTKIDAQGKPIAGSNPCK